MGIEWDVFNLSTEVLETIFCTCKNLKHLDIPYGPYDVAKIPLKKWINFQNLQHLGFACIMMPDLANTIVECLSSINGEPLFSPSVLDEISKLQCLEHLNLSFLENLRDSTIIAIANNCKNLKSLDIEGCNTITKTALDALTNLKNLQKLNVGCLDIITDSFLMKLKGLKELNCNECKKLTDAGIIQFIKNNSDLEKISVSGIDNITNDMVIGADQATKNRTNGIILYITECSLLITEASKSIITSQWLVVESIKL
ncbi:F-box/LRR-repeat protein 2-like [Aphidius gifuensis]|uniref:F-box/LRR-repeat protein 2-like n=1 Tax=Aphidius gifuensis TaxID=684658 RepID=UPI001CDD76F7|nr:F-box/LRR-repeat protein 2-like [Aphidius gifuensis]